MYSSSSTTKIEETIKVSLKETIKNYMDHKLCGVDI